MDISTIERGNKVSSNGVSKVMDTLKKKKREIIEVQGDSINDFIKENKDKIDNFKFSYDDTDGNKIEAKKRLFISTCGKLCQYNKGSSRRGSMIFLEDYKNVKIEAVIKKGLDSNTSAEDFKKLNSWKTLSKFRNLTFHKNLIGNRLYEACKKIPKTMKEWEDDQEGKAFKEDKYKSLYDYGVTSGCTLDGKVIGEKRLETIFGEHTMKQFKTALDNKEKFSTGRTTSIGGGYEYSMSCEGGEDGGPMRLFLCEEYKDCGNGHYYVGCDWNKFIYVEKD